MSVWEVFGRRTPADRFVLVGSIEAPDEEMAVLLARETHFRHKEAVGYAVRRRGDTRLCRGPYEGDLLGGVTDRSYRRQEAYAGVGGRLRRLAEDLSARGIRIDRPRPPVGRATRTGAPAGNEARGEAPGPGAGDAAGPVTEASRLDVPGRGDVGDPT